MGAMLTPEDMQAAQPMASYQALAQRTAGEITPAIAALGLAGESGEDAYPLPEGWRWFHDTDGWGARTDDTIGAVWVDADGNVRVEVDASDLIAEAPQTVALAVILANMGRGSLESIETDRDDARRALCEQIEDYWNRPAADLARMLYPDANLYPDQDPPPPTPAKV